MIQALSLFARTRHLFLKRLQENERARLLLTLQRARAGIVVLIGE